MKVILDEKDIRIINSLLNSLPISQLNTVNSIIKVIDSKVVEEEKVEDDKEDQKE